MFSRRTGRRSRFGRSAPTSVASIFGASLLEEWNAAQAVTSGGEVLSVTGSVRGSVLAPASSSTRPAFTLVNSGLGGRPSIDCARTGVRSLFTTGLSIPLTPGNYQFAFAIFRLRSVAASGIGMITSISSAVTDARIKLTPPNLNVSYYQVATIDAVGIPGDTLPHVMGTIIDDAGITPWVDGTLGTKVAWVFTPPVDNIQSIGLGGNASGTETEDVSIALQGFCDGMPSNSELNDLYALAQRYGVA